MWRSDLVNICISLSGGVLVLVVVRVEIFHYTHNNNNTEDHYSHIDTTRNLPIQLCGGRGRLTLYVLILSILALSFSKCVLSLLHQPASSEQPEIHSHHNWEQFFLSRQTSGMVGKYFSTFREKFKVQYPFPLLESSCNVSKIKIVLVLLNWSWLFFWESELFYLSLCLVWPKFSIFSLISEII